MRYREITLAFVIVAVMATVLAFSGTDPRCDRGSTAAAAAARAGASAGGYLGLVAQPTEDVSLGTVVRDVLDDGPAGRAGIRPGDVITTFDGQPVVDGEDLQHRVAGTRPGTTVTLQLSRSGRDVVVTVELGERPAGIVPA